MNKIFSKNLRKLRQGKRLTQEYVAERLGVSAQAVSRWETGATLPDVLLLPEIARLYEVLVDDLFKADLQEYGKLSDRLVAVYIDTLKNDDFMAGIKEYERMEREGSMEAKDYYGRTWLYGRMMGVCQREIMKDYDKTMELSKENDPELYNQAKYGKVVYRVDCSGEGQQCIEELLQAVKDNPEDVTEWVCLETAYYWAKRYEECYRVAKEAIAKFPEESDLYCLAGDACKELGKYEEAYLYWEKRYELDPQMLDSLFSIAFCREELGEYDKAYEAWMRLVNIFNEWDDDISVKFPMRKAEECKAKMGK
ncbi:MAG: helix-turn-helix domain-containing protein [Lachnospiraceae bacterium]|nr:helix-turn-helix domain-containing protein [Lachnospiraceae bacterium]